MYHSQFSPHAMVHLVGSYQANSQFLPLQNHGYYGNGQAGTHKEYNQYNRHGSNHNRQRGTQQGSYPHDYSPRYNNGHEVHNTNYVPYNASHGGSGAESSSNGLPIDWQQQQRFHSPNNHHHHHPQHHHQHQNQHHGAGTPQRPNNHHPNGLSVTPIGSRGPPNYNGPNGKKGPWNNNNKLGKRHQAYNNEQQKQQSQQQQQQLQQQQQQQQSKDNASCSNSDSGFSSRSPTPNKYYREASQAESSDDRDSQHSSVSEPKNKQNRNTRPNNRGNLVSSMSMSNLYYNNRQSNENAVPNQQNRRKYPTMRSSPNSQRQRGKKFNGPIMPEIPVFPKFFHSPADRFLEKAYLLQYKKPTNLVMDKLSKAIWEKFEQNQLSHDTFVHKMLLWRHLFFFIKTKFPQFGLYMVGSTLNGFGTNGSDVDMCLFIRDVAFDQRNESIYRLSQIMSWLRRSECISHLELIQARVPILKIHDSLHNLDIDLNYNNVVGIRNTHLMYCYSRIDWRVRPLVLVIKMWAQCQNINNARDMTLSSYSLVLMVIHFLQTGVDPPVLPCLHNLFKDKFHPISDIHNIDIHEELNIPSDALQPYNTQTLGELLIEFFKYYDSFDFDQNAISVRVAGKIPIETCRYVRALKNDPHQWKYLCIEGNQLKIPKFSHTRVKRQLFSEPFDFTNTARSVYDATVFQTIKDTFRQTHERLSKTKDLNSIFTRLENNNDSNGKEGNNSDNP